MGLLWEFWHLPLYLDPTNPMSNLNVGLSILFNVALTALYTWLYNNTHGSLFFVAVLHAMSNTVAFVLAELGVFVSSYPAVVVATAILALAIVLIHGPQRFGCLHKSP